MKKPHHAQKRLPPCDGPDTVCHHSGLTKAECDYSCDCCNHTFVACPDRAEIYKRAAVLREAWPVCRLDKQEQREWNFEIPTATKITDHMRRKTEPHDQH